MKKLYNAIKTGITCARLFYRNPQAFSNEGFMVSGKIMQMILDTSKENQNMAMELMHISMIEDIEVTNKITIWTGIYNSETASESPFERIQELRKEIERLKNKK